MDQLVFDKKDTKKELDCESSSEVGSRDMSISKITTLMTTAIELKLWPLMWLNPKSTRIK